MALDPYDYDEKDRPNAYKSRKKTGKWCKGVRGKQCEFVLIDQYTCYWMVGTRRNGNTYAHWKCGCKFICANCSKHAWKIRACKHVGLRYSTRPDVDTIYTW